MDDVLRTQPDSDWLAHRRVHDVLTDNVVFRRRILTIQTDVICVGDELGVRASELSVGTRIMERPGKLLAGNLNDRRVCGFVRKINRSPHALSHENEYRQNDGGRDQKKRFGFRIVMPVGSALAAVLAISSDKEAKRPLNQHKSNPGNNEYRHEKAVNPAAVFGSKSWKPIWLCDEKI